jgi:hypothetical protein
MKVLYRDRTFATDEESEGLGWTKVRYYGHIRHMAFRQGVSLFVKISKKTKLFQNGANVK